MTCSYRHRDVHLHTTDIWLHNSQTTSYKMKWSEIKYQFLNKKEISDKEDYSSEILTWHARWNFDAATPFILNGQDSQAMGYRDSELLKNVCT